MHCNKWLVTQPPFSLMGLEREVFHICRLPHIFHFSISVDIRAAFVQPAWPRSHVLSWAWKQTHAVTPQPDLIPVTWWAPSVENTCCWLAWSSSARAGPGSLSSLSGGQAFWGRLGPEWAPPPGKSWGSRAWSCLPSAWSSSFSWQFSSSLASWSPCPHLKVRAHLSPLWWLTVETLYRS